MSRHRTPCSRGAPQLRRACSRPRWSCSPLRGSRSRARCTRGWPGRAGDLAAARWRRRLSSARQRCARARARARAGRRGALGTCAVRAARGAARSRPDRRGRGLFCRRQRQDGPHARGGHAAQLRSGARASLCCARGCCCVRRLRQDARARRAAAFFHAPAERVRLARAHEPAAVARQQLAILLALLERAAPERARLSRRARAARSPLRGRVADGLGQDRRTVGEPRAQPRPRAAPAQHPEAREHAVSTEPDTRPFTSAELAHFLEQLELERTPPRSSVIEARPSRVVATEPATMLGIGALVPFACARGRAVCLARAQAGSRGSADPGGPRAARRGGEGAAQFSRSLRRDEPSSTRARAAARACVVRARRAAAGGRVACLLSMPSRARLAHAGTPRVRRRCPRFPHARRVCRRWPLPWRRRRFRRSDCSAAEHPPLLPGPRRCATAAQSPLRHAAPNGRARRRRAADA